MHFFSLYLSGLIMKVVALWKFALRYVPLRQYFITLKRRSEIPFDEFKQHRYLVEQVMFRWRFQVCGFGVKPKTS